MYRHEKNINKNIFGFLNILCFLLLFTSVILSNAVAENIDEYIITVTRRGDQEGFIGGFGSNPISLDIISDIMEIDYVEEIVPVVTQYYGMVPGSFPQRNFSDEPPNWDESPGDAPPDWNGSRPDRNFDGRMQDMVDFIVEGIPLDSLNTYIFYTLPVGVVSGRLLDANDSSVVYIGEDAQKYFNVSIGEEIAIEDLNFTVVGIFSSDNYSKYVFMNTTDARILLNLQDYEVNTLYVYVDELDSLEKVSTTIQERFTYLMTRYLGGTNSFRPPSDNFQVPYGEKDDTSIPGFELFIVLIALSFIISHRKISKGGSFS